MTPYRALTDIARLAASMLRHCPPETPRGYRDGLRRASRVLRMEAAFERGTKRNKAASKGGRRAR